MKLKIDSRPLRLALRKVEETREKHQEYSRTLEEHRAECAAKEQSLDLSDLEGIRDWASRKNEVEKLPELLERFEKASFSYVDDLVEAIELFERELLNAANEERESLIDEIEKVIRQRGWASDVTDPRNMEVTNRPRRIAESMPSLGVFPTDRIGGLTLPSRDNLSNRDIAPANQATAMADQVVFRAQELLRIYDAWKKGGGSFLTAKR